MVAKFVKEEKKSSLISFPIDLKISYLYIDCKASTKLSFISLSAGNPNAFLNLF